MLIQVDAAQLEWRVCLELCRDETGIREVLEKQDTHSLNQQAFNLPSRLISKIYLFRTIFNHGKGYSFTVDPNFMHVSTSMKYWDDVGEKFYTKYAGLEALYQTNMALVASGKPLIGPLGRFWPLKMERDWKGELKLPETKVVNYPVQGTGADVMSIARVSFWNRLRARGWTEVKLVSSVHDSIVVDAPAHYLEPIAQLFHDVFRDLVPNIRKLFNYEWIVPLECEVKAGNNLKDMTKVTF